MADWFFVLDTSVLRTHLRRLPSPRDGVSYVVPVLVVQELLAQAIDPARRTQGIGALRVFERPDLLVGLEAFDRLRQCFGLPKQYPESTRVYLDLVSMVLGGAELAQVESLWREAAEYGRVAYGPDWLQEIKRGQFEGDIREMASLQRAIYEEGVAEVRRREAATLPPPGAVEMSDREIRHYFVQNFDTRDYIEMWYLNQVAAMVGVPGVHEHVASGYATATMRETYAVTRRHYVGGLALFLSLAVPHVHGTILGAIQPKKRNDLPDLLIAAAVGDGDKHVLVTEENTWNALAAAAGVKHKVMKVSEVDPVLE